MSRLRVAYVAHSVDPLRGGMELVSARLLERLAREVDLEVVAGDGLASLPAGVRRTRIRIPSRPSVARLVIFDVVATVRLRQVRRRCDLVHSCGAVAHAPVDLVTLHLSHASVIDSQGGTRPPGATGLRGAVAALRRRLAARLERWTLQPDHDRMLAAVSTADASDLARRHPYLAVRTIENGVDLERFTDVERDPGSHDDPILVVVIAGDFERKGVATAIEAIAATSRCRLRVLGEGDLTAMRALADGLGVSDRVELVGHRRDVAPDLAAADVLLSCSLHESFGLSLVEGAASGCALVCTDTGVGPELCGAEGDPPGGFVVSADSAAIAVALDTLDGDRARCRAMGAVARTRAQRFTWDAMTTATLAAYAELMGRSS